MALVIATITGERQDVLGSKKSRICTATIASYTSGGEAVADSHALAIGLRKIQRIEFLDNLSTTGFNWRFDSAVPEIMCFEGDADAVADAPGVEADASDNCGTIVVRVLGF